MDQDIQKKFEEIASSASRQEIKLDDVYKSVERMRKYFMWTLIVTIATIVLPLIALIIVIPWFLKVMSAAYNIN